MLFLLAGNFIWAQTEIKISKDSLPSIVKENLHKKYHGYTVAEAVKATDKNGVVMYKIHAKRKKSEQETIVYELHYALSGKFISKKKDKEIYYDGSEKSKPKPTKSNDGHGGHQH